MIRDRGRRYEDPEGVLIESIAVSEDTAGGLLSRILLNFVLGGESASTRTIAVLHLVDGMTLEEVAAEVGLSVSGVRKRLRTLKARVGGVKELV